MPTPIGESRRRRNRRSGDDGHPDAYRGPNQTSTGCRRCTTAYSPKQDRGNDKGERPMNDTTHAPRTAPALAVRELFSTSPRLAAGFATSAVAMLTLAAIASIG